MDAQSITFEEHGFPTELFDDRDIERAVAARRLMADSIVYLHGADGPATATRARDVARLKPFFGIEDVPAPPSAPDTLAVAIPRPLPPSQQPPATRLDLARGQNIALPPSICPDGLLHVRVDYVEQPSRPLTVDVSAFLIRDLGRTGTDDDMVFYNNAVGDNGSVRQIEPDPARPCVTEFSVRLQAISADVQKLYIAASLDVTLARDRVFGDASRTTIAIVDPVRDIVIARYDHTDAGPETALILGELYRRAGAWKFRAVGQGYGGGLRALAQAFGVNVD